MGSERSSTCLGWPAELAIGDQSCVDGLVSVRCPSLVEAVLVEAADTAALLRYMSALAAVDARLQCTQCFRLKALRPFPMLTHGSST